MTNDLGGSKPLGLIVAMPMREKPSLQTEQCLLHRMGGYPYALKTTVGMPVVQARNHLAKMIRELDVDALPFDPDFVLWVDDDAMWTTETVQNAIVCMLANRNVDILSGYCGSRMANMPPALLAEKAPRRDTGVWEVYGCGFHWVMMHFEVLKRVGNDPFTMLPPDVTPSMPEDFLFCLRARAAGMRVWCDTRLPVAHIEPSIGAAFLPFADVVRVNGLEIDLNPKAFDRLPDERSYGLDVEAHRQWLSDTRNIEDKRRAVNEFLKSGIVAPRTYGADVDAHHQRLRDDWRDPDVRKKVLKQFADEGIVFPGGWRASAEK